MAVVEINALRKLYPGTARPAVDGIDFTVADGEFLVLVGPSGCGKSTVLRMIAGLEPISSGRIAIDGRIVNDVPAKARDIAMVFQSYALYPHMRVYDNIAFGLRRRAVAAGEIDRRVREAAAKLGLTELLDRKPHALSGGQRQRVALGRAIVREPKVFLFDEPLSNLDAALRVATRNELVRQQRDIGTTSIFVTHDEVEAMTMGDRICVLSGGRVAQIGAPLEVYRNPADTFVARFIGSPPMNLFDAILASPSGGRTVELAGIALPLPDAQRHRLEDVPDGPTILGVRPEDVGISTAPGTNALPARVTAVEALGAETLVVAVVGGTSAELTIRAGRDVTPARGTSLAATIDMRAAHFFDPATGRLIAGRP